MKELLDLIKGRKSVRSYDGRKLSPEEIGKLEAFIRTIDVPFDVPVRFVLLDAEEHGLASPVLTGEKMYVAGIVEKVPHAEEAYGYAFEKLVLYAWSLGIGTVWIGGTMKREDFEKAAGLKEGEMMPCMSPLGHPAPKRSFRESMMRRGVGADSRFPAEKLFFAGSFADPVSGEEKEKISDLIEAVRWAPSAVNKQPWRIVLKDGMFHLYEQKDKGYIGDKTGDLQKIDVGIALCHLVAGLEAQGKKAQILSADPGIALPANTEYVCSVSC